LDEPEEAQGGCSSLDEAIAGALALDSMKNQLGVGGRTRTRATGRRMPSSPFGTQRVLYRDCLRAILVSLVAVVGGLVGAVSPGETSPAAAANWSPVHPGDFPDPSVLQYQGSYYAFATQSFASLDKTINIQVSTSSDGIHWTQTSTDALPDLPSWAKKGDTWAPSVAYETATSPAKFVMYYAATVASDGLQCLGLATSATPLGPYVDTSAAPVVCQTGTGGSIDPDVFTDHSGQSYLLWKSDGNAIGDPSTIWSEALTPSLTSFAPSASPVSLLTDDEAWQAGIIEGPDMVETQTSNYYLFYGGNDFNSSNYAIGWATCPGPASPCTDAPTTSNPLLTSAPGMSGPGGPDVYSLTTPSGPQLVMAFAPWQGTTIGYFNCGIRPMYEASLSFSAGTSGTPELADTFSSTAASSPSCQPLFPPRPAGYWQVASDGGVFTFGAAAFYGSTGGMKLNQPVVGMAPTPDRRGYWLVASDGGVFSFGDAGFHGSTGNIRLNKPVIGMIPTFDGGGYWLIASDGGVFTFGDARFYGSTGGDDLAYPVTAAVGAFLDAGYWLVDSNGQVFSFGDAPNEGQPLFAPGGYRIAGMATTHDDNGYWLSSANGNVANFGDAVAHGSMFGVRLNGPIVGMTATFDGGGYWLQGADGGIFCFGDAPFLGSMGGIPLNAPMVGITST
jgi:hypothetical protein